MNDDFRQDLQHQVPKIGIWHNLGSVNSTVISARLGYDWLLLDYEHGAGDESVLLHQITVLNQTRTIPVVRIPNLNDSCFMKVLDWGARAVMVPQVKTAMEARHAVHCMRFPPQGHRGVSRINAATNFGIDADAYLSTANQALFTIIQIETLESLEHADAIAAIDGVDVLFVGPTDLSYSLDVPGNCSHPRFRAALQRVLEACHRQGKSAGILVSEESVLKDALVLGFTFIAYGSDAGILAMGMKQNLKLARQTFTPTLTPSITEN